MFKTILKFRFLIEVLLLGLLSTFLLFYFFQSEKKIRYVDTVKLFDGFTMTKEMKRLGEKEFNTRKLVLDSIYSQLQEPAISALEKKHLIQRFIQGKQELEGFNAAFAAEESTKIWSRIKSYTVLFSEENDYQLLIGSDTKHTVLFADPEIEVTDALLTYINKKYEGIE